jgi:sulfofructose kinase
MERHEDPMAGKFDILGLGAVAVDDLFYLEEYPKPDSKVRVVRRERQAGGLTGTALVTASRMACACAYAGTVGFDEHSQFILDALAAEGVSVDWVVRREGARPFCGTVLVDLGGKTRTILVDSAGVVGADDSLPPEDQICSCRVLFVDDTGLAGMVRAARIARGAGIPVIADLERVEAEPIGELLALADHLIVPLGLARELSGKHDAAAAVRALSGGTRSAVVVTAGAEGSWYAGSGQPNEVFHQPAFRVAVTDTTGCGDVFHGAYAAGLCQGMGLAERVRFASAVAALKATAAGGQKAIPSRAAVDRFLAVRVADAPPGGAG